MRVGPCPTVVGRSLRAAEGTTAGTDIRVGRPVVRQGRLSLSSSVSALSRTFRIADTAVDPLTNGFISESRAVRPANDAGPDPLNPVQNDEQ